MAEVRIPANVIVRNDTAENWKSFNSVLLRGEIGLETDTGKMKFGDGVKRWSELPYFSLSVTDIVGMGTAATLDSGVNAGNVPVLGENGKLNVSVIPALAVMDVLEVSNETEMLALDVQQGDIAVRSDLSQTFILKQSPASKKENWILLKNPTSGVISVNGQIGAVTLSTDDIAESGAAKYYTEELASANFTTNIAKTSVSTLKDGGSVLFKTDTLILNGGNARG